MNDWPSTKVKGILVLILLAGPFYLNDFASIFIRDWRLWLFVDYAAVKLFPALVVLWMIRSRQMRPAALGLKAQRAPAFLATFLAVALVGTVIDQNGYGLLAALSGYPALGGMPAITSPFWNGVDLTLGLLAVGIMEELVFRGFLHNFLSRYTTNPVAIVAISAAAFGLIHWSQGLNAVLVTAVIGAVFMLAYLRTRSLPAIMLAHFMINVIDFAGVIPKAIFKLL
jgi:hypothetical protein